MMERGPNHFILFRDEAGEWCAAPPNFVDLAVHPTGWGRTAEDAIIELLRQPEFHDRALKGEWPMPRPVDFIEVPEPDGAKMSVGYDRETKLPRIVFGTDAVAEQRRAAFNTRCADVWRVCSYVRFSPFLPVILGPTFAFRQERARS